jgi:hypothetical protein
MILTATKMVKNAWSHFLLATLLLLMVLIPAQGRSQTQKQANPTGSEPIPEPTIPAILAAFDKYEVVAMPEDHGLKDLDDLIFALVRNAILVDKIWDAQADAAGRLRLFFVLPVHCVDSPPRCI